MSKLGSVAIGATLLTVACARSSRWLSPSACQAFRLPASTDSSFRDESIPRKGDTTVEQRPWPISHPALQFPAELRGKLQIGHVVVEAIVDTAGRVEIPSLKALSATDSAFIWPAYALLIGSRWCPGVLGGRRVRVRIQQPFNFSDVGRAPS